MNDGDVRGRTQLTAAQRLVKHHGGQHGATGVWCKATEMEEAAAFALAEDLRKAYYQVLRPPYKLEKTGKYEVIFR